MVWMSCKETEFFMQLLTHYIWLAQIFCSHTHTGTTDLTSILFLYVHARVKSVQFYITKNLQEFLCSICISFSQSREKEIGFVLTDKL